MPWLLLKKAKISEIPLYLSIVLLSSIMYFKIRILPFKKISENIGKQTTNNICPFHPSKVRLTKRLSKIQKSICKRVPWKSNCYNQALVAAIILSYYKIPFVVFFGLKKDKQSMKAHAWVKANNIDYCGGQNSEQFTVVARYTKCLKQF